MTEINKRLLIGVATFIAISAVLYLITHWVVAPFDTLSASDESTIRAWSVMMGGFVGLFTGITSDLD